MNLNSFVMKLASTGPWNGSRKQARKTYCLAWPVFSLMVVLGLVDQGEIRATLELSAISEAGGVELVYTAYCDLVGLPLPPNRR